MDPTSRPAGISRFGVFEIDLRSGELRKNGIRVRVQEVPLRALRLFLSRPRELLSREEFRQALWSENVFVDFDRSINTAINRLRETLGDTASNPRFIETVSRSGYRWIAPIQTVPRSAEELPGVDAAEPRPTSVPGTPVPVEIPAGRRYALLALTVSACVIGLAVVLVTGRGTAKLSSNQVAASTISPSSSLRTPAEGTRDPEAKRLYLEGRFNWDKRTPESLNRAVDSFTQAIVHDPNYAAAYSGLADCYNLLREFGTMPPKQAYPRAFAAAKRAVALDDSSAPAHLSLAFATFYGNFDAPGAEREFHRSIELDPKFARARHWYATFLCALGRYPQALEQIEIAQQLDPASIAILADKGFILLNDGRTSEGIELLKQVRLTQPGFVATYRYLETACLMKDDYLGYLDARGEVARLTNDQQELAIVKAAAMGYGSGGQQKMWEAILKKQQKFYSEATLSAFDLAATYSLMGHKPEALHYLGLAFQNREPQIVAIHDATLFSGLHQESAFQSLLAEVNLP